MNASLLQGPGGRPRLLFSKLQAILKFLDLLQAVSTVKLQVSNQDDKKAEVIKFFSELHGILQQEEEKILLALESAAQGPCDQLMAITEQLKQQISVSD